MAEEKNINNNSTDNKNTTENKNPADTKQKLFREKNLERLESPEKLNDYLRVTSPGVWLVLGTVIVLLAGVCLWGIFGRIDATVPAAVVTEGGESVCYVPAEALEGVIEHRTVTVNDEKKELKPSVLEPQMITETTDVYTMLAGRLSVGDIVYPVLLTDPLPQDGVESGILVTETLSPVSLFF